MVFSEHGEIGPLDVQLWKKDELFELESGLTVMASLEALHEKAFAAFEHFLLELKTRSGGLITLRTATELSATLASGLFSPIFEQIDPVHVGEAGRAMTIANEYGSRLRNESKNFSVDTLDLLVSGYPSHDFVIDRKEAEALFSNVRAPEDAEQLLADALKGLSLYPRKDPLVEFLSEESPGEANENGRQKPHNDAQA